MREQKNKSEILLVEPMHQIIPRMAIPSIIAFLINSTYSLADTYFVSILGTNATAAVSVNTSLDQIILMAGSLMAVGANSYIARLLGAENKREASFVLSTAFFLAAGLGLIITMAGSVFMRSMVQLLGATYTCEQYAMDYATYVLLAAPFMATSFVMNQCLRAEGNAFFSMFGMGFGGILNCVLDPIFIFTLKLGVAGASMATAISKVVSFAILLYPYLTHHSMLKISPQLIRIKWEMLREIVSIGASSMLRAGFAVISAIILNNIAGEISDSVLAGIGVSTKIMMFPFSIILGFGTGFQPVVGFNWGAKRYNRVWEGYRYASRMAFLGATIMGALVAVFAEHLIALFSEADPQMLAIGAYCIRVQGIALPIHAWVAIINMLCSGLGYAKYALTLATARQGSCFLPIVIPMVYAAGGYGVASIQAVADALSLVLAFPIRRKMLRIITEKQRCQIKA